MIRSLLSSLITFFLFLTLSSPGQDLEWAKQFNTSSFITTDFIQKDAQGNIYSAGTFYGTADFDPGPATYNLTTTPNKTDVFILKQDPLGNFLWVKKFTSNQNEDCNAMILDKFGNIYCAGKLQGTLDADPGPGVFELSSVTLALDHEGFIVKLNSSGNFIWAKQIGGNYDDRVWSVWADSAGSVYSVGDFRGTVDFNPGPLNFDLTSASGYNAMFIWKLDSAGNFAWAKKFGSSDNENIVAIQGDRFNNLYLTGSHFSSMDADPGPSVYNLPGNGTLSTYIAKLNSTGDFIWAKALTTRGSSSSHPNTLKLNSADEVFISGYYSGTLDFDPGMDSLLLTSTSNSRDIFIERLDTDGNYIWTKTINGPGDDRAFGLDFDTDDCLYISGSFQGTADFNPGPTTNNLTSSGSYDGFILKLDPIGNHLWNFQFGGSSGQDRYGYVYLDSLKNIYLSGLFAYTADFNPRPAVTYNLTHSTGIQSSFVAKWGQCFSPNFNSVSACNAYTSPVNASTWTSSGTYKEFVSTPGFCDSVVITNLTVHNTATYQRNVVACGSYTSPSGNYTWNSNGTYHDTVHILPGCDSLFVINLNILYPTSATITEVACGSYTTPSGSITATTSGTYNDTITNAAGCDSILTINLTVLSRTTNTINVSACSTFTSPSGNYQFNSSGVYLDTIPNHVGCDSVITINLSILNSYNTIQPTACDSFVSPDGTTTYTSSGTYYSTIPNSSGCDSIITVDLTLNYSTFSNLALAGCNTITTPAGNTLNQSGTYSEVIMNSKGCDSLITINAVIGTQATNSISVSACNELISPSGNYIYTQSGNYQDTLVTSLGCDSILFMNVTITTIDTTITQTSTELNTNGSGNSTFQWLNCQGYSLIPNATNATFSPSSTGSYAVEITQNGCVDTSECYQLVIVGEEFAKTISFDVYPNPSTGIFLIQFEKNSTDLRIEISNILAEVLLEKAVSGTGKINIEIPRVPGIYFLSVYSDERRHEIKRLIVQ